ncbi:MAG: GNAT family N-acetyltransferase [Lachnospiraceae bacterium]|nr:GNAT family N-acetyltransferase [Lachnospiraceae bacterium]
MPEIERLTGERNLETRALWEEVFCEDSRAFVDYYYSEKAPRNIGFVIREEGQIRSMLFLTPYEICVQDLTYEDEHVQAQEHLPSGHRVYQTCYIVGVATQKRFRHRGYMTMLLQAAFDDMRSRGIFFAFLMPANPAIYEPFGFRYIYERWEYLRREKHMKGELQICTRAAEEQDSDLLAAFAMRELARRYHFFLKRDRAYYALLIKELASQNGAVEMVFADDSFVGYYMHANEEAVFVQEALFAERWEKLLLGAGGLLQIKPDKKPIIMGKYLGKVKGEGEVLGRLANGEIPDGYINEIV